jgi:3-methyladenine DNA glycosylase AlkC
MMSSIDVSTEDGEDKHNFSGLETNFLLGNEYSDLHAEIKSLNAKVLNRENHISYLEDLIHEQQYWIKSIQEQLSNPCSICHSDSKNMTDEEIETELSVREKINDLNKRCNHPDYLFDAYETVNGFQSCSGGRAKYIVKVKQEQSASRKKY